MSSGPSPHEEAFVAEVRPMEAPSGTIKVLIVTPQYEGLVSREVLARLRRQAGPSPADEALIEVIERFEGRAEVFLFRGRGASGSWMLSDELDDDERREVGYHLVRTQLSVYRAAIRHRMHVVCGAAFRPTEYRALRDGTEQLVTELEQAGASTNMYLVKHLVFYTALDVDRVLTTVLPNKMQLLAMRADQARRAMA